MEELTNLEEYEDIKACLCNLRDGQCHHVELWRGANLEDCIYRVEKFRVEPNASKGEDGLWTRFYEVWLDDNDYSIPVTHAIERERVDAVIDSIC